MQEKYIWIGGLEVLNFCKGIELIRVSYWKIEKKKKVNMQLDQSLEIIEFKQSATDTQRLERGQTCLPTRRIRVGHAMTKHT